MLESLPIEERKERGLQIGQAIYGTLMDQRTTQLFEHVPHDPNTFLYLRVGLLHIMLGRPEMVEVLPEDIRQAINKPEAQPVLWRLIDIPETYDRADIEAKAGDLLVEALDDSVIWFSLITLLDTQKIDRERLTSHPSIFAATSVTDKVNRTIKALLTKQIRAGFKPELPQSREAFLELYDQAPQLFNQIGIRLELSTEDTRDVHERGLCPAKTWDAQHKQTWLKQLLDLVAPVYLEVIKEQQSAR